MTRKRKILLVLAIVAFLCLLLIAGASLATQSYLRARLRDNTPLVSIVTPHTGQAFGLDDPVRVHAVARELNGLQAIELWIDGLLITVEQVPDRSSSTMLVLHEELPGITVGAHEIVVRARSAWGSHGQAAAWFEMLPGDGAAGGDRTGTANESVALDSPGFSRPDPAGPAPGSRDHMMDWLSLSSGFQRLERVGEPIFLQLEILALRTDQPYEGLHCYLGAAEVPPRWYPDADYDQSTDESFPSLGAGFWDVDAALSGERSPNFLWRTGAPVPLEITCVALTAGGTDALELGSIVTSIEPDSWDGIARRYASTIDEGWFELELRLTPLDEAPSWHLLELDRDMAFPTNLRMGFYTLHWDYEPDADEEPIDGFRVILNGDVLWTEPPGARQSYLAYEWLSPPCGMTYTFTVDAVRGDDWSLPSNPVVIESEGEGSEACDRTLILTFDMLETYWLPDDEDHDGWVGPLSGTFYAGEHEIRFDSHCSSGGYCDYFGMGDEQQTEISRLTSHWGSGPARFVLHVPPGEDLVIGFEIRDHDGRSGSEVLCGDWRILEDRRLSSPYSGSLGGYLDNCRATYSLHPTLGSVISDPDEPYPLPELGVADLSVDDDTGQLRVHVRNYGRATWPAQDLEIALLDRGGAIQGTYIFDEPVLRPGETDILTLPELAGFDQPPLAYCVLLDPADRVPEYVDRTDIYSREPYCRPLPDLTITGVLIEEEAQRILLTIRNIGEDSLSHRKVGFSVWFHDRGTPYLDSIDFDDVSLEPWQSRVLIWEGVPSATLARMANAATVRVDDSNRIAESNEENNEYELADGGRFRMRWVQTTADYVLFSDGYGRHVNLYRFSVEVRAEASGSSRVLVEWAAPGRDESCQIRYDPESYPRFCLFDMRSHAFELGGDETLVIEVRGHLTVGPYENGLGWCIGDCEHPLGNGIEMLERWEWSAVPTCSSRDHPLYIDMEMAMPARLGGSWSLDFNLCREVD